MRVARYAVVVLAAASTSTSTAFVAFATRTHGASRPFPWMTLKGAASRPSRTTTATTSLLSSNESSDAGADNETDNDDDEFVLDTSIQLLGYGKDAVIRPGVVLVAPPHEHNTYLKQTAVFLYGQGQVDDTGEFVTRGVVLDHPTAFTMQEMTSGHVGGSLGDLMLFRGGDCGEDKVILLHSCGEQLRELRQSYVSPGRAIADSGIFEGGLQASLSVVSERGLIDPPETLFKFFFNYVEFTKGELENMLNDVNTDSPEDEDAPQVTSQWMSLHVPPKVVLGDYDKADAWHYLRNQIQQQMHL